jgi:antitoxin component of MazEF toxin-antitoxin module
MICLSSFYYRLEEEDKMVKCKAKKVFYCLCLAIISSCFPITASAEEGADFTISPIFGEGQTDPAVGYFSIKAENGGNYPLKLAIQNLNANEEQAFEVQLVRATTSNDGRINYTPSKQQPVNDQLLTLEELLPEKNSHQKMTIQPNQSKEIKLELKIPKNGFEGTLLGSIYVKKIPKPVHNSKGIGIRNAFAMTIPVIVSQNFEKKQTPKVTLTDAKIEAETGIPKVVGVVANSSPVMFGKIHVNAWITKKDDDEKLYEKSSDNYEMAPNSSFQYSIETEKHILKPGHYTYHLKMKSGEKVFRLARDFNVNKQKREQVNKQLLSPEANHLSWALIIPLALVIVLLSFIAYGLGRKKGMRRDDK